MLAQTVAILVRSEKHSSPVGQDDITVGKKGLRNGSVGEWLGQYVCSL